MAPALARRPRPPRRGALSWTLACAAALAGVAACSDGPTRNVPTPPTMRSITTAAAVPDLATLPVEPVPGRSTTTAVPVTGGDATLSGQVVGPDGPVAGATVHLERFVGDQVGVVDVVTAADGTWSLPAPPAPPPTAPTIPGQPPPPPTQPPTTLRPLGPTGILGGRYRVRAWRSPDLAATSAQVLFLGGSERKVVPISVARYQGLSVTSDLAPNTPVVGQLTNLLVFVTNRSVDEQGIVRSLGVPASPVQLFGLGAWTVESAPATTDGGGRALFRLRCRAPGPQAASVSANGIGFALQLAGCVNPPPSTTAPPSTIATAEPTSPGGGGSTTTTGASATTSTT